MFQSRTQLGFPRKVVAYYLLFCLLAITWLSVGLLATSHSVLSACAVDACLARLGKTAAAIEIAFLREGTKDWQTILNRAQGESGIAYSAIVDSDGTILAHSTAQLVGTKVQEPIGTLLRSGNATGVRFVNSQGQILRQYRVSLAANGVPIGSLRIAINEPSLWTTFSKTARVAPLVVLVPLAFVLAGAIVLSRLSSQAANVDSQLRAIAMQPAGAEPEVVPLPARDSASLGWNRMVDFLGELQHVSPGEDLDHRLTKAASMRKQNDLTTILQNLSDGVAVTDPEGRITFANRAITALLGVDSGESELDGMDFEKRLIEKLPGLADGPLFDRFANNRATISESSSVGDKAARVIRVARQPLQSERLKGQLWSMRDITQQKLAEKMRDQFIDTATHELRTPLSNIKAYAETLATCEKINVEEQKEFCNIINSETTRLARFVDDLLSISSMEVGSLSADRQKVETSRLFAEVEAKVMPMMQKKNIVFESRLPEKMPELHLDKEKMVAVLVNLLGNAAKYTPNKGHVSMKVKIDDQQLQISVEDTGVGIAANELPLVFEKFFRSTDARVQAETGTGLGLALAQEVVRMHGGEISVDSQIDQGSTFTVTIPIE